MVNVRLSPTLIIYWPLIFQLYLIKCTLLLCEKKLIYVLIKVSDFESLFQSRIISQNYGKNIHEATSYFIIIDESNGCFSTYLVFRTTWANTQKTNRIFKIENCLLVNEVVMFCWKLLRLFDLWKIKNSNDLRVHKYSRNVY